MLVLLVPEPDVRAKTVLAASWLTPSETARLRGFGTEARRETFVAGRWLARRAVQRWLGRDRLPVLDVVDDGACRVADVDGVYVSISHSAGFIACVASGVPVGVDLESLARSRDHVALAEAVHGPAQREQLAALSADVRALTFLRWWTLKEAWLKARGRGLDFALMRALAFDDGAPSDAAVTRVGDLVLAVVAHAALPPRIDGLPDVDWQRCRSRLIA